jgi:predicted RNase H-like nuclease (RuvC/YqgF family)
MNEEKVLKAIEALADTIDRKEAEISTLNWTVKNQREKIKELEEKIANELGSEEQYESTIRNQRELIENLQAKIYDLEERIDIMTETEAPAPMWEIEPPKNVSEVVEVTNVTKVIEG